MALHGITVDFKSLRHDSQPVFTKPPGGAIDVNFPRVKEQRGSLEENHIPKRHRPGAIVQLQGLFRRGPCRMRGFDLHAVELQPHFLVSHHHPSVHRQVIRMNFKAGLGQGCSDEY